MMSEDDAADYRQQTLEKQESRRRERTQAREPNMEEPCGNCDGEGSFWQKEEGGNLSGSRTLCSLCLGTRVQP